MEYMSSVECKESSIAASVEPNQGRPIIITAPLTECIDHAGYFIQMGMASMPVWLEWIFDSKYPHWRQVEKNPDGSARYMPAGARVLEKALLQEFPPEDVVACFPEDLDRFIGPQTRVVAVSTHNPLGVTFAAGVYASVFGTSRQPINAHHTRQMFQRIQANPFRRNFQVIVGGSGGWQISQTNSFEELGVDCVVDGRAESSETLELFRKALRAEALPQTISVGHPSSRDEILVPEVRTTFGVVEMTTGCGRRCQFCLPDLNPQLDVPKGKILAAVRGNVEHGNKQISLATEDMFIWGQLGTSTPFFFPNREALLDLYRDITSTPGVEQLLLSHSTIAPAVVDPLLIKRLSDLMLDKSPVHLPRVSTHPRKKILSPLIGLETGSVRLAKKLMPGKALPFSIEDWPSVLLEGLRVMNANNWFPVLTIMIGNPGETDEDVKATLDLVYEIERRKLFGFLVPSIFTPLLDTKLQDKKGVLHTSQMTALQWQLLMKCWKINLRPGQYSWWGPTAWRVGSILLWLWKLRRMNGPNFTWPLLMFSGLFSEKFLKKMGKIYIGQPLQTKSRKELIDTLKPGYLQYLHPENGDMPEPSAVAASS
jgi:hypothetical protein